MRLQCGEAGNKTPLNPLFQLGNRGLVATALLLTIVGGFVDAVGYIALFEIFTANMSGNSIHIGMYLSQRDWPNLLRPLCAVASYVVGMLLTRIALEISARAGITRVASYTLTVEALLLAVFARAKPAMHLGQVADVHTPGYFLLIAMLAFAMGVQTATLTHVGGMNVYTTFVTGTLTKITESLTRALFWVHDELCKTGMSDVVRQATGQKDVREATMLISTWTAYVLGAALGAASKARWQLRALYVPVAVLAGFVLIDRFRPISSEEEKHQTGA